MADHIDPSARLEGFEDARGYRYAPDCFDVAPSNRLPVSDDRKCLQDGSRVARRLLRVQALQRALQLGARLKAPAARYAHQLDPFVSIVLPQIIEHTANDLGPDLAFEQLAQLGDWQGFRAGQQGCFQRD